MAKVSSMPAVTSVSSGTPALLCASADTTA